MNSIDVKAATHPSHNLKTSSRNAHLSGDVNASQRRTVNTFHPENFKATNLFSSHPAKPTHKKRGKENLVTKQKGEQKVKSNEADQGLKVYQDTVANCNDQKKDDFGLICDERVSERYWELLAEERRKALEIALEENKELANDIEAKEETIKDLQEEVADLKETVKHTEIITSVLENFLQADTQPENTKLRTEEKSCDQLTDKSYTNASGHKSAEDNSKVESEAKCKGFTNMHLESPSCSNVVKETHETDGNSCNQRPSNISGYPEAATNEHGEQEE